MNADAMTDEQLKMFESSNLFDFSNSSLGKFLRSKKFENLYRPPDLGRQNSRVDENRMNLKCREASEWNSPPQLRRGGRDIKKMLRSHL